MWTACSTTPTRDLPLKRKGIALHVIAERYPSCGDLSLARDADLKALPGVGPRTVRAIRKFVPHGRFGESLMQACEKCEACERETAQTIVSMIKAAHMTMSNDREGHPLHSYQQNTNGPGMFYVIDLIERAYNLQKPDQK